MFGQDLYYTGVMAKPLQLLLHRITYGQDAVRKGNKAARSANQIKHHSRIRKPFFTARVLAIAAPSITPGRFNTGSLRVIVNIAHGLEQLCVAFDRLAPKSLIKKMTRMTRLAIVYTRI